MGIERYVGNLRLFSVFSFFFLFRSVLHLHLLEENGSSSRLIRFEDSYFFFGTAVKLTHFDVITVVYLI